MIVWHQRHPAAKPAMLGRIPQFFSEADTRSVREQIAENYAHGGGWRPFAGFKMLSNGIKYPGDPLMRLLFEAQLRNETIRLYESAWLAIVQSDGSFEISRVD